MKIPIEKFRNNFRGHEIINEILPSVELIEEYIEKNKEELDFGELSESLPWTESTLEKFKDKWDWHILSKSKSIPWTPELIERFEDKWDWSYLSRNKSLPWATDLIEKFIE